MPLFFSKFKNNLLFKQLTKYVIVGFSGVAIDGLLYLFLIKFGLSIVQSKTISIIISVSYGYFMNSRWTFQSKRTLKNAILYCIIYGISILQNVFTNSFVSKMIESVSYNLLIAFFVASFFSMCITFLGNKFIVFVPRGE
jgi:putative flippase GtrA